MHCFPGLWQASDIQTASVLYLGSWTTPLQGHAHAHARAWSQLAFIDCQHMPQGTAVKEIEHPVRRLLSSAGFYGCMHITVTI